MFLSAIERFSVLPIQSSNDDDLMFYMFFFRWSLGNHENFALQNADSTNFYITEKVGFNFLVIFVILY